MLDAEGRLLPDFLIVGAMRGGTNSLGHSLDEHPEIFIARGELHFFDVDERWRGGAGHYSSFFQLEAGQKICGERTPAYSDPSRPGVDPPIPKRIAALLPETRLVWSLRDPVERAWSQQVRAFRDHFPRERMHFILADRLFSCPEKSLRALYAFLGVNPDWRGQRVREVRNSSKRVARFGLLDRLVARRGRTRLGSRVQRLNKRLASTARPDIQPRTRARLAEFFRPHNEELAGMTGLDLAGWSGMQE
jgi:hypothetical protein